MNRHDGQPTVAPAKAPAIADHELFHPIAAGSYGEVWLARNAVGTPRAVKIVRRDRHASPESFDREFKGLQKFEPVSRAHEGLVDILTLGLLPDGAGFYYVMELADDANVGQASSLSVSEGNGMSEQTGKMPVLLYAARTLRAELKSRGALPADEVIALGLKLAAALAHLHAQGLVHRDVKPSNILFIGGEPKLADAGLVAAVDDARSLVGTAGYIAPEGPGSPRADLYALGKVLYEAAFAKDRQDFPQLPPDLASRPDHARLLELNAVLLCACATNPRERYASAGSMLADLELLNTGKSVKRRRSIQRGWAWSWKAAALLALVGLGVLLIRNERDRRAALTRLNASPFEKSGTTNRAAWEAFSRGGILGTSFTPAGFSNAVGELEKALELDPTFTQARVLLAGYLCLSVEKGYLPGSNALQRARAFAQAASARNPQQARPWYWLGESILGLEYDLPTAERLIRKAIKLDPNDYSLRHNFACILWYYGRFEEAESILKQAIREDSSRAYPHARLGLIYSSLGRLPDALSELSECILLAPTWPAAHIERAEILWAMDRRAEAARDWLRYVQLNGFTSIPYADGAMLGATLEERGPDAFLQSLIDLLKQRRTEGRFVSAYDLARLQALAGDKTGALDDLEKAVDEHRIFTLSAKVHVAFKDFQDEPRYHAVLRRLKLEK